MTYTNPTFETSNLDRCHHHGQLFKVKWQHGIAAQLSQLFDNTLSADQICPNIGSPKHAKHGQFTLPLHRIQHLFAQKPWCSQTATENAQWIVSKISSSEYIETASAIGPFVNFVIPRAEYIEGILQQMIDAGHQYGFVSPSVGLDDLHSNKTTNDNNAPLVLISCDLPLIPLLLDPNHFRGLVLGTFLQRSCRIQGQKVRLVNTLNAWNTEFGYLALAASKYGRIASSLTRMNQIYHQVKQEAANDKDVEKEAQNYLLRLEQGDAETVKLWQELQDTIMDQYHLLFDTRLCIEFDRHVCTHPANDLNTIYDLLEKCDGLIKSEDGEWKIDLESVGLGTSLLRNSNGVSTQLARDIAQIIKVEQTIDEQDVVEYHIAGHHLTRHIQQAHHIVGSMNQFSGQPSRQRIHVDFGKVKYDTTNTGFCVLECLDVLQQTMLDIMEENEGTEKYDAMMAQLGQLSVTTKMKRLNDLDRSNNVNNNNDRTPTLSFQQLAEKHADRLGLCTMMIQQLTQRRSKPMSFSASSPPHVFGNSGVFLQYVHSRLCGIEQRLVRRGLVALPTDNSRPTISTCDMGKLLHQQEVFDLVEWMTQFPRILQQAHTTVDPSPLVSYLFKLARMANQALYGLRIKDVREDLALARWTLFWAARQTLANGLVALGIKPVYRM